MENRKKMGKTLTPRQKAVRKAWKTINDRISKMTPRQKKALDRKRSEASRKAWETRQWKIE